MKKTKKIRTHSRLTKGGVLLSSTLCMMIPAALLHAQTAPAAKPAGEEVITLDAMSVEEAGDPNFVMPTQPLQGALGFSKTIVETPRAVSTVSSDLIDKIGIRDGDQLSRIVPGTYTVNRWGIAGSTQVRGLPADTYLRGMKRIDAQGNVRNVITMWESTEIVRGPPSPIFGNGRIGGYVNYTPKSVRGTTGKYMEKAKTSVTAIVASYDRIETQFNHAQPFKFNGREAGFQVFGLASDAESYYQGNFQEDKVLQGSLTLNLNDKWRVETGAIYQQAVNAGQAGINRVDQRTFDKGTYLRGTALVNLDTNADGRVSELEIQRSRSQTGVATLTPSRPLSASFGRVETIKGPDTIIGAPATLRALLLTPAYASVAASPQGAAILAAGNIRFADGSPANALINNLNLTPYGFFLNPATLQEVERDNSLVAIEEKADGFTNTGYLDFIDDTNPDIVQKLQLFYDFQQQQKESQLPFNQKQKIAVYETKYTGTRQAETIPVLDKLPDWAALNLLSSVNARYTSANRRSTSGDYDHRRDLITGYLPTDTFASFVRHGDQSIATGEPISADIGSKYLETGIGAQADLTLFEKLNILGGARKDWIDIETEEGATYGTFTGTGNLTNYRSGTLVTGATPAFINGATAGTLTPARSISNKDNALSHSVSASYKAPFGITPYVTRAVASSALTGTFQEVGYGNVRDDAILSGATLKEGGFKGNLFNDKVFYAVSFFDQIRTGNIIVEGESFNRSTQNKGTEIEVRWLPNRHWSIIGSATFSSQYRVGLDPAGTRTAAASANFLGVQDIKDAAGNIIVPANAYLYGGNSSVTIPNSNSSYDKFGQYPDVVLGSFIGYNWDSGFSVSWSANWVDSVSASSELPDLLILPSYITHNLSAAYDNKTWRFSVTVRNALDEEYFVPNNGSFGGQLLQPGLPTNWELAATRRF